MELIIGQSKVIRQIKDAITTLARTDVPVCIYGEPGTGKTLIAEAIHARDPRGAGRPLAVLRCATLAAYSRERDKIFDFFEDSFQIARRGTLVLKQVAVLSALSQAGLLHAIEQNVSVDTGVRVIATTTTDLLQLTQQGQFRTDLFHRLVGFPIIVPPLRKRKTDIPWLVAHFIRGFNVRHCRDVRDITPQALRFILNHDWPGNVRELKRCVERACMRTDQPVIDGTELLGTIDALKAQANLNGGMSSTPNEEFSAGTQGPQEGPVSEERE